MKAVTITAIKQELKHLSQTELIDICLQLSKFKKENKELVTYLLFESSNEEGFIETVKDEVDMQFLTINTSSYFYIKKSVRKILRFIKTNNRYSKNKETEITLLLYFCVKMLEIEPSIKNSMVLKNIYLKEKEAIKKKLTSLHEDLQYDFTEELNNLKF
ncbi:MAG: hypothetical protein KBE41_07655 [Lutibacter sp.]|nr:hypothetical protein [Lutibacter sp.]MBP9601364.1 hypothetical protein [Lutibacter sp.]